MIDIDLLRRYRPETDQIWIKYRSAFTGLMIVLGLMILIPLVQLWFLLYLDQQIKDSDTFLEEHSVDVLVFQQLKSLEDQIAAKNQFKKKNLDNTTDWHGLIGQINGATPASVAIQEYSSNDQSIVLNGSINQKTDISPYITALRNLPGVKDVSLDSWQEGGSNALFKLTINLGMGS